MARRAIAIIMAMATLLAYWHYFLRYYDIAYYLLLRIIIHDTDTTLPSADVRRLFSFLSW